MWQCEGAEGLTPKLDLTTDQVESVVLTNFMSTDKDNPESWGFVHWQQPWQSPVVSSPWTWIMLALLIRVQLVRLYYMLEESHRGIMVKKTKGHYSSSQNSHNPTTHVSSRVSNHVPSKPIPRCLVSKWLVRLGMTQIKLVEDLGWWAVLKVSDDLLSNEDLWVVQMLEKDEEGYDADSEEVDKVVG